MTKSTITREESVQAVFDLKVGYRLGFADLDILKRVARMALAAMDSEKLALENFRSAMEGIGHIHRTLEETFGGLHGTHVEPDVLAECKAICDAIYAAYRHAQPAPVVPNGLRLALSNAGIAAPESDEMLAATCEKHIQALVTWVKDRKPFQSAPVVPSFEEWLSAANRKPLGWVKDAMREAYDACRAAMLQAGNSPVIPDGYRLQPISEYEAMCATVNSDEWPQRWIPVSERMPEDRTQVILWDAEIGEVTSGHYSHKTQTFYHCGDAIENEITHWMLTPAAPQEVQGE
ncbi:DUF551 domain-containing protein [Klebsiella pneumoniae]|uniref:DUF551 domain-containing protein n=1 Tax=Klebsiella pneumoniae TaxID=573 RepID=UPI003D189325